MKQLIPAPWLLVSMACAEQPDDVRPAQSTSMSSPAPFASAPAAALEPPGSFGNALSIVAGAPAPAPTAPPAAAATPVFQAPPPAAVCGTCTPEYPCQQSGTSYTCQGQLAEGPATYLSSPFRVNGDGTVTDTRTSRQWQKDLPATYAPACSGAACTWEAAMRYCLTLSLNGGGWRLPTKAELESIIDFRVANPAIDRSVFSNTPSSPSTETLTFWSASSVAGKVENERWSVYFSYGVSEWHAPNASFMVRCIR